ncbi:hypothetical protein EDC01DRAFT_659197 [Geopyxis carbonaria]|nr:hypothetical protein EDC01DRAFT_659197 [Geopyxis carbonaria]
MSAIPGDSFSSILSRFAKSASPPDPSQANINVNNTNEPRPIATSITRPRPPVPTYATNVTAPPITIPQPSPFAPSLETRTLSIQTRRPPQDTFKTEDVSSKRRKVDQQPKPVEPLSEKQKEMAERKKKLMAIKKMKDQAAARANTDGRITDVTESTIPGLSTKTEIKPTKTTTGDGQSKTGGSYRETLARAAQQYESRKAVAGTITHKARTPVEHKKEWQKRLADKQKQKDDGGFYERTSKSPGIHSGGEKPGRKAIDSAKSGSQRKSLASTDTSRNSLPKGNAVEKKASLDIMGKRKRTSPPVIARNAPKKTIISGYRGISKQFQNPTRRQKYEEEDEEDDWIVDDEDDEPHNSSGNRYGYSKRYRYAESDYDSDSDMEAAGADVLEEEERSRRAAIKEDQEQEKLEAQLAARKAALKRKK